MKRNHVLLMLLGCLIPLAGFAAVTLLRVPISNVLLFGLMLLCPLLHIWMMGRMDHGHAPSPRSPAIDGHHAEPTSSETLTGVAGFGRQAK